MLLLYPLQSIPFRLLQLLFFSLCLSNLRISIPKMPDIFTEEQKNRTFAFILSIQTQMETEELNLKQSTMIRSENVLFGAYSMCQASFISKSCTNVL